MSFFGTPEQGCCIVAGSISYSAHFQRFGGLYKKPKSLDVVPIVRFAMGVVILAQFFLNIGLVFSFRKAKENRM